MTASSSPSQEADISIGSVLDGRYRIDAVLGSGGMGRVYRGEHTGIGRAVAIKVLHADLNRNREAAQRFQREALASGRLDHPNIVGVSDFGIINDGPCYLVMEALEGESLGERLTRDKRIPWPEALEILRGVLHGLGHAHDRGVVHRDIKPDNVFLARKDGETVVKILDFGIAKLYAGSPDDPASTRAGLTVGTPAYLSPEQAVGGEIRPASDLYSSTIVLFEMITGRAPFEDKDPLAMLGAHVSRPPPTIAEIAPDLAVPAALEELIQRGMIKTQADRITAASDYLATIDAILSQPRTDDGGAGRAQTVLGVAPTASSLASQPIGIQANTPAPLHLTPYPGGPATPYPGGPATPYPGGPATPMPGSHTPMPGTRSLSSGDETTVMPAPTRAVSLAEAPPIPRNWLKVGALVLVVLAVLAVLLAVSSSGRGSKQPMPTPGKSSSVTPAPKAEPVVAAKPEVETAKTVPHADAKQEPEPPPEPIVTNPIADAVAADQKAQLKTLLQKLQNGKTCPERKKAVAELSALGDPAAIPSLKRARFRMRGGVLGLGQSNANGCLKADAEAAIKALTPVK